MRKKIINNKTKRSPVRTIPQDALEGIDLSSIIALKTVDDRITSEIEIVNTAIDGINMMLAGMNTVGEWDPSVEDAIFPTTRPNGQPLQDGDHFLITATGEVENVTYTEGNYIKYNAQSQTFEQIEIVSPSSNEIRLTSLNIPSNPGATFFIPSELATGDIQLPSFTEDGQWIVLKNNLPGTIDRTINPNNPATTINGKPNKSLPANSVTKFTLYNDGASTPFWMFAAA